MSTHFQILGGKAYAGQGGKAYGAANNQRPTPGGSMPVMDRLTRQTFSYESLWIFPNLIIAPLANVTFAMLIQPEAVDRTTERMAFYFNGDDAMGDAHAPERAEAAAAFTDVNNEDIEIVESCQRGRRSPAVTGGVFMTKQESTSLHVQRILAGHLLRQAGHDADLDDLPVLDIHHS